MSLVELPFRDRIARALPYLAVAAIVIGMVNFFWFMGESMNLGDANQGKIVDGRYFLGNKGTFTEVTRAVWDWSVFHGVSVFVTHPLALAGMAYLILRKAFPAQMAGSVAADSALGRQRMELVRGSGPLIARDSMGGRVGPVSMTEPLLEISVYPNGLIVRAKLMSEHAIFAAEIVHVGRRRVFFQRAVEIEHLGVGSRSPLIIYRPIDDPIVTAIRSVMANNATGTPSIEVATSTSPPAPTEPAAFQPNLPVSIGPPDEGEGLGAELRRWSLAGKPAVPGIEPRLSAILEVAGLGVGVVLLALGVLYAIPKLGSFGFIWTIGVIAFLAWNGSKFVRRHFLGPQDPAVDRLREDRVEK